MKRSLMSRKKSQIHSKLLRYDQRIAKIQALLSTAETSDVIYLTKCLKNVLAKREIIEARAHEINRIEEEMEKFKDSVANMETRPR
jgi:uncharacterized protein (DUF3084 family)